MRYEYDATGEKCPLPLVKTRVILKKMQTNDSCVLRLADKGSKTDIPKFLTKQGYSFSQNKIDSTIIELNIKK